MKRISLLFMLISFLSYGQNGSINTILNGADNQVEYRKGGIISNKYFTVPFDNVSPAGISKWSFASQRQNGRVVYDSITNRLYVFANGWKSLTFSVDTNTMLMTRSSANSSIATMSNSISQKLNIVDTMPIHNEIVMLRNTKLTKPTGLSNQVLDGLGVPRSVSWLELSDTNLFVRKINFNSSLNLKLNISDTSIFARKISVNNALALKLNTTDTSLLARKVNVNNALLLKLNTSDTNVFARKTQLSQYATNTALTTGLSTKFNNPTGNTSQVILGNGTLGTYNQGTVTSVGLSSSTLSVGSPVTGSGVISVNLPATVTAGTYGLVTVDQYGRVTAGKRQERYSGVTASGSYTVVFSTPYSVAPNIQANIIGGTSKQFTTITVSTTGFTVSAYQLNSINLLATDLLLSTTVPLNGANIDVLISEK